MNTTPGRFALTPDELARFDRDGFIGPFKVYEPEEAAELLTAIRCQSLNCSSRFRSVFRIRRPQW